MSRLRQTLFIRLFMAPGVAHCGGGTGPAPGGQLEALITEDAANFSCNAGF